MKISLSQDFHISHTRKTEFVCVCERETAEEIKESVCVCVCAFWSGPLGTMGWLRFVGSLKLKVSFAKEPYRRDDILQKRPIILRSLLIVATPYLHLV